MSFEQAKVFNEHCNCVTVNQSKLEKIQKEMGEGTANFNFDFQHYFSSSPTSISKSSLETIELFLKTFGNIIQDEKLRSFFLKDLDPKFKKRIAKTITGGLFLGFDFHDTLDGPKLIEINTNAGGLLLNSILYEVQDPCCRLLFCKKEISDFSNLKKELYHYFQKEWSLYFPEKEFETIAILDDQPESQFLYPEFKIFQNLFLSYGKKAVIVSPDQLELRENGIYYLNDRIDFIYNRHTDFLLKEESMKHVSLAWEAGHVCLSPNPVDYLLYANKSNLETLSNVEILKEYGIEEEDIKIITEIIPKTYPLKESEKEIQWGNRKKVFFKPKNSFASKGVYAGRKISKLKFDEILKLDYVAQTEIPPSLRKIHAMEYKIDYRAYVYHSNMLMLTSRLYQGQTTNFRTLGGGFSAVMEID